MKKYFTLLFLLVITIQAIAQNYPVTGINISLSGSPDPNTANWKSGTSLLTISATTLADNGRIAPIVLASKILVTIKKGGVKAYGDYTINSAPASDFNTPSKIYKGDSAVSFIGKSFILAPGDYEICVQFFGDGAAGLTPISEEKTKAFSISIDVPIYQAPQVIAPVYGTVISEIELQKPIVFGWTSVVPKPTDPVNYRITVWQLMQGQTGEQAMKANRPIIIKDVDNLTQIDILSLTAGPCIPPYMCEYIWTVQALNQEGKPIGENNGTSKANTFQIEYDLGQPTNMCDNFNFELRKIYTGDSVSYQCMITNKYTGAEPEYKPKSFRIKIKNDLVFAIDEYAAKEWNRTPSKFPPGSSQIKWTNNSGDIPQGETNLGTIYFGVPTVNPFYVIYEWLNNEEKIICKDSTALLDSRYYYELVKEPSNAYTEISDTILRVQFFNQLASIENIKISICDVEVQDVKLNSRGVIKLDNITGQNRISIDIKDYNLEPGRLYLLTVSDLNGTYYLNFKVTNDREKIYNDVTDPTLEIKAPVSPISNAFTVGLKFSEPVTGVLAGITVNGGKVEIYTLAGGKEYNLLVSANKQTLVTIVLSDAIKDLSVNANKFAGQTLTYTTGDFSSPQLVTWSPTDGETIADNHPTLKMSFNENVIVGAGGSLKIYKEATATPVLIIPFSATMINGKDVTVSYAKTQTDLDKNTRYYILVDGKALKDNAGNEFVGVIDVSAWTFNTGSTVETSLDYNNIPPEFKVYPNPFVEYIKIDNASELSKVIVTNIAGQVVKEVVNPSNTIQFNKLQSGVYFISLYKTDNLIPENFKIVKRYW